MLTVRQSRCLSALVVFPRRFRFKAVEYRVMWMFNQSSCLYRKDMEALPDIHYELPSRTMYPYPSYFLPCLGVGDSQLNIISKYGDLLYTSEMHRALFPDTTNQGTFTLVYRNSYR